MKKTYIYGCGGIGCELADILQDKIDLIGFIDDNIEIKECYGYKVYSFEEIIQKENIDSIDVVISVGEPNIRERLSLKLEKYNINEITINLSSFCSKKTSIIGKGTLIHIGAFISIDTKIGRSCIINKNAIVGHNSIVNDYSVISPHATLGGDITIGKKCFIGLGASIRNGIKIGNNSIVGMGAVVTHDIEDNLVVAGNPCKVLRTNISGNVFSH